MIKTLRRNSKYKYVLLGDNYRDDICIETRNKKDYHLYINSTWSGQNKTIQNCIGSKREFGSYIKLKHIKLFQQCIRNINDNNIVLDDPNKLSSGFIYLASPSYENGCQQYLVFINDSKTIFYYSSSDNQWIEDFTGLLNENFVFLAIGR